SGVPEGCLMSHLVRGGKSYLYWIGLSQFLRLSLHSAFCDLRRVKHRRYRCIPLSGVVTVGDLLLIHCYLQNSREIFLEHVCFLVLCDAACIEEQLCFRTQ